MKIPLGNAHATEAVVAVRKVVAQLQVGAVAAILRLNAVGTGVAVLGTHAVAAIGAQPALPAVGAMVATVAVVAEHAIGASSAAAALVRARVTWVCGKTAGEEIEPLQEVALSNLGDLRPFLFILHDLPLPALPRAPSHLGTSRLDYPSAPPYLPAPLVDESSASWSTARIFHVARYLQRQACGREAPMARD